MTFPATRSLFRLQACSLDLLHTDRESLPTVLPGFELSFFAREPLVRQPCSMAFDAQGRLFVGMGPQYRNPKPDTDAVFNRKNLLGHSTTSADNAPCFYSQNVNC